MDDIGILNSINKKDRLYKLLLQTDVNSDKYAALKPTFKQYRETLRRSIKEAKKIYYHRTFLLHQNNVRKTWSAIKETLHRKKKHELPNEFVWNNHVVTSPFNLIICLVCCSVILQFIVILSLPFLVIPDF